MNYDLIKVVHALAAVVAVGPMIFAPWLSRRLKNCHADNKTWLLSGLNATDTYYNIAGWVLILTGIGMFYLQDWHRIFQLWFILSVVIFIFDSIVEKRIRDPANDALANLQPSDSQWSENTDRLHQAVTAQMLSTALIFVIMLVHSQLNFNLLDATPFSR